MSSVDERVVSMKFENAGFEQAAIKTMRTVNKLEAALSFTPNTAGIESAKKAIDGFDLDGVSSSVEECSSRFGMFGDFVSRIFANLQNKVMGFGKNLLQNLTIKPFTEGFSEYETQINSVQTILSNAGDKLKADGFTTKEQQIEKINANLDELNEYADKTIYNFSEMTRNIGTFTAAGVELDTATKSIQGISNLAAASGSTSQQASTAMYQLSQAISSGTLRLQDWNSVVNAGMGGALFQEALKRTARAHGIAVDEMIEKNGSFRESLIEGWITSDVLTDTLEQLTIQIGDVGFETREAGIETLKARGYTEEEANAIIDLAQNAQEAATKVRTWSQLWDTIGEALGSGWAATWRIIVGDFLEATDLFTHISDGLSGIINASSDARNSVLEDWAGAGGRTALVDGIKYAFDAALSVIEQVGKAFSDVFGISAEQLFNISAAFATFAEKLVPSKEAAQFLYDVLYNVFTVVKSVLGVFGNFVRVMVNVASVIWKVISPFVKFVALLGGALVQGLAFLSSLLLKLTDYLEGFIDFGLSKFGSLVDYIYGGISKLAGPFGMLIDAFKSLSGMISSLIGAFAALIAQSAPIQFVADSFKTFGSYIEGKLVGTVNKLKNAFFGTNKQHKEYAENWNNLTPFQKAEVVFEDLQHRIKTFGEGFVKASDKVAYLKTTLGPAIDSIKDKFKSFFSIIASPALVGVAIKKAFTNIKFAFSNLVGSIFGEDVSRRFSKALSSLFDPIAKFFGTSLLQFRNWGEVISGVIDGVEKALGGGALGKFFKNAKKYFSDLAKSGKSLPDIFGTIFLDAVNAVKYGATHIPELLSKAAELTKNDFEILIQHASEFKDKFAEKFREALSKLPSPEEIGNSIGSFISGIQQYFADKLSGIFSGGSKFSIDASFIVNLVKSAIENAGKLISGIKAELPTDFVVNLVSSIGEGITNALDSIIDWIDFDKIGEIVDKLIEKIKEHFNMKTAALVTALDFFHSLSTMNKGIGSFAKNFGNIGESIGEGLSKFGEGFTKYKKQTKAQAFMRIATGMLILAGALWVLSKIPSDRLADVAVTLSLLGAGIAVLSLVVGKLADLGNVDMESIGKTMAGFGIGVAGLAVGIWLLSKVPSDKAEESLGHIKELISLLGLCLIGISKAGGNLQGAASTLIAMSVAIILLMIPIEILGRTPNDVLVKGEAAVLGIAAILTGAVSLMELANIHKSSILGAAPTLLALAISITLLMIPIEILGRTDEGVLHQGGNAVGLIAGVLGGVIAVIGRFGKYSGSILAATPALLALAFSITLMIIPIKLLGSMDLESLKQGEKAVGVLAVVLGGVIALIGAVGANAAGILAGSVGLIALAAAVGIMSLIVAGLSAIAAQNPEGLWSAVRAVVDILGVLVLSLGAIGAVGTGAGMGLLAIAGGIAALGLALMVLAAGIMVLQNGPNWGAIIDGINGVVTAVQNFASDLASKAKEAADNFVNGLKEMKDKALEIGHNAIQGILDGIGEKISEITTKAQEIANSLIDNVKSLLGIQSPSTVMADVGRNVVQGLIDGIGELLENLGAKAGEIGTAIVNGVGNFVGGLATKAKEGLGGFLGIFTGGAGSAQSAGAQVGNSAVSGMDTLASNAATKGVNGVLALAKGLSSGSSNVNKSAAALNTTAIKAVEVMGKNMTKIANNATKSMASALRAGVGQTRSAGASLASAAKSGASGHSLYSAGTNLAAGFARGIAAGASSAINAAIRMASSAIKAAKNALKEKSPSRVFMGIGRYVSEGFAIGINQSAGDAVKASKDLANSIPEAFGNVLDSVSINIEDILDTDYSPEITPVINATSFDSGIGRLRAALGTSFNDLSVGNLNYTGELSAKISDANDLNQQMVDAMSNNAIDYGLLGVSVANALIQSGVHVEIDGGQLMGYLAGEIKDVRRMYG